MKPSALQRLDLSVRQSTPVILTLLITIVSVVPVRLPEYPTLAPDFVLIAVFYWTVHRPDLIRAWTVFVIGLFDDILSGGPLGVNALVLVLVHAAIVAQHKAVRGQSFLPVWCVFGLLVPAVQVVTMVVAFAAAGVLVQPATWGIQILLTVAVYPAVVWLLSRAQRMFLARA